MKPYSLFRPTPHDARGLGLPDQQHWLVLEITQTRDSGALDRSNFSEALKALGGESETVEVHRFNHWGPGWFEIILVDPADKERVALAESIESSLENYPILNESAFSELEAGEYFEAWKQWGQSEFGSILKTELGLSDNLADWLRCDCDADALRGYFQSLNTSGDYYYDDSINLKASVHHATRDNLAAFVRQARKAVTTV